MRQKQQAQERWIEQYGHVRPVIAADHLGKKFVAIGNRLEYSETWKFIPDFLLDYVPHVFGKDWWDARQPSRKARGTKYFSGVWAACVACGLA